VLKNQVAVAIERSLLPDKTTQEKADDMNFKCIKEWLRNLLADARPLADRASELSNTLGKFLPRSLAISITSRVFRKNPGFDLWDKSCELTRYLLNQAIADFQAKVAWLESNLGIDVAMHWVRSISEGRELFFPPYLQGCFGDPDEEDHRGGGR